MLISSSAAVSGGFAGIPDRKLLSGFSNLRFKFGTVAHSGHCYRNLPIPEYREFEVLDSHIGTRLPALHMGGEIRLYLKKQESSQYLYFLAEIQRGSEGTC